MLCRVEAFTAQAESYKLLLRSGMREQRVASRAMLRKVPDQLRSLLSDLDDPSASSPLPKMLSQVAAELHPRAHAAKASFRAAVADLLRFFEKEYIPQARSKDGCQGLPDGDQAYALALKYHTTTSMTPDEVHQVSVRWWSWARWRRTRCISVTFQLRFIAHLPGIYISQIFNSNKHYIYIPGGPRGGGTHRNPLPGGGAAGIGCRAQGEGLRV